MAELFAIETDRVTLQWSVTQPRVPAFVSDAEPPPGRLDVTLARRDATIRAIRRSEEPAPRLFEQTSYAVYVHSPAGTPRLLHDDPALLHDLVLSPDGHVLHGTINFRSQVGRSTFRLAVDDQAEAAFTVEVFPSKLDYENDYLDLIADTQDFFAGLALDYLRATHLLGSAVPSTERPAFIEWLTILDAVIGDLEKGLRRIAQQPLRSLRREPVATRLEKVRRADAAVQRALARGRPAARVVVRRPQSTLDTPEHRWLAAQLRRIRRRLTELEAIERARPRNSRQSAVVERLARMVERIGVLLTLDPMRETSGDAPPGFASLQLQRSSGYRQAYDACIALSLRLSLDADALRITIKDLDELYEYWCYLAIVRILAEATGSREPLHGLVAHENGLRVSLERGTTHAVHFAGAGGRQISATYNPKFSGVEYLLPQQPDFIIAVEDSEWPRARLVIDAKYRVDASESTVEKHGIPAPPDDALNVLHRYRDAILAEDRRSALKRDVIHAVAVYPYRERREGEFARSGLSRALQAIGVGAIPLLPRSEQHLDEWLRQILRAGGWSLADRVIPHEAHEVSVAYRAAESRAVLVAVLREDEAAHLQWIREQRLYYAPETKQGRLFSTRFVAFYERARGGRKGVVRSWAKVRAIETRPRSAIATPWLPSRAGDERQVVFHLEPLQPIGPIINDRLRFSVSRWSTELAMRRAKSVDQLYLETEAEWRLFESLKASGIAFGIHALNADALDEERERRGRARFEIGALKVRHLRGSRFVATSLEGRRELSLDDVLALALSSCADPSASGRSRAPRGSS